MLIMIEDIVLHQEIEGVPNWEGGGQNRRVRKGQTTPRWSDKVSGNLVFIYLKSHTIHMSVCI